MSFIRTVKVGTNPLGQLRGGEQAVGFDHGPLAMDPFGFNGIEPGTLFGQKHRQDPPAFARQLDLLVMFTDPGAHPLTIMPGSILPDHQPGGLALSLKLLAAPVQKWRGNVADRTAIDKAQGHLVSKRSITRPALPQHSITGQRFRIRIGFLPLLLDKANRIIATLPGKRVGQREATPPDLVEETDRPGGNLLLLRRPTQQSVTCCFFPS
jgi:hypothetical protein